MYHVTAPIQQELIVTRTINAPHELIWKASTTPYHLE